MLDLTPYIGKFVAIDVRKFEVVAVGNSPKEVLEKAAEKGFDLSRIEWVFVEEEIEEEF